jgi:hypothetical protein
MMKRARQSANGTACRSKIVLANRLALSALVLSVTSLSCRSSGEENVTTAASADAIGVAECDEYLSKYEKGVSLNPAASRAQLTSNVSAMRASWKQAAANPAAHAGLSQGCKQALATAKTTMASSGCEW